MPTTTPLEPPEADRPKNSNVIPRESSDSPTKQPSKVYAVPTQQKGLIKVDVKEQIGATKPSVNVALTSHVMVSRKR